MGDLHRVVLCFFDWQPKETNEIHFNVDEFNRSIKMI
jgi:hypothetical protein